MRWNTLPLDGVIRAFPLETHGLEEFFWEVEIDLLAPGDHVDESEDGVIEIVDAKGVNGKRSLEVLGVVDEVDDAGEDGEVEWERGGEEQEPARGEHCCQL